MNDDWAYKIWRITYPMFIYSTINMVVSFIMSLVLISSVFDNSRGAKNVYENMKFLDSLDRITKENVALVMIISAIITIPIIYYIAYKEQEKEVLKLGYSYKKKSIYIDYTSVTVLGISLALGLSRILSSLPIDNILGNYEKTSRELFMSEPILLFVAVVILMPIVEEFVFRKIIYNRIKLYSDKVTAVYLSAIFFGFYHMNLVQGIYAFLFGIIFAYLYEEYNDIRMPITLHIAANAASFIMNYFSLSRRISNSAIVSFFVGALEVSIAVFAFLVVKDKIKKNKKAS